MADHLTTLAGLCRPVAVCGGAPGGSLERVGVAGLESGCVRPPDHGERGPGVFQCHCIHADATHARGGPGVNRRRDLPGPLERKLEQMLATDLTDSEIILGKLAARLVPMLALVTC